MAEGSLLRLKLTGAAERALRSGHPWLFESGIAAQNRPGQLGDTAALYDRKDRLLGLGLFDPESPLRVRLLHLGKPQPLDASWWARRLHQALERRHGLFGPETTGYRCIHGESDSWPGLVLDRYGSDAVLKLYTAAWLPRLPELVPLFLEQLQPQRLVLRLSRNIQRTAREAFHLADGQVLHGPRLDGPVEFLETGLRFEADLARGQKTGFFLDQRDNRRKVESLASGRSVLNAFSFSGGFSLYAARGGASSVTDVDISPHALAGGARNVALNRDLPNVVACRRQAVQADAFEWLPQAPGRFGLIILDPPSLARRQDEAAGALRAYSRLAQAAAGRLLPGGILLACSCSAHVGADAFFDTVRAGLRRARRPFAELLTTGHPPDHPATFPEARYLKAIYLSLD